MSTTLVSRGVWSRLTKAAAASAASANVAVAYFSEGASRLLPLKQGSRLVVDFSERAVRSGQTCPADILKLIRAGVDVYNVPNLHAKVFVFRNRAFIGSTNASHSSATALVEAVIVTDDRKLVASMRQFVRKLCLNWVTLHEAKQMARLYRPPRFANVGSTTRRRASAGRSKRLFVRADLPPVRIVHLVDRTFDREEWQAQRVGKKVARKRIKDTRHYFVDFFLDEGRCCFVQRETVVQVTNVGHGKKLLSPPAKVVHLQPVPNRRPMETIVFLELPKKCRRKNLKAVVHQLGGKARELLSRDLVIRDRSFVEKLLGLWRTSGDNKP
jgi:hypothetical protein